MPVTLKYELIADDIREQILDGRLRPGDPAPSGRVLSEAWNVARGTAVKAMEILRGEGLIEDRQGSGFYVVQTPVARPAGGRAAGTTRVEAAMPFRILGKPRYAAPPAQVADAMRLADGEDALARTRVLMLPDGSSVSVVTAWFPRDIAEASPMLLGTAPLPGGTTRYVMAKTGLRPVRGRDVATARLATDDEAEALGIQVPSAVQVVMSCAFDAADRVLVCEEGVTSAALVERVDEYPMNP